MFMSGYIASKNLKPVQLNQQGLKWQLLQFLLFGMVSIQVTMWHSFIGVITFN